MHQAPARVEQIVDQKPARDQTGRRGIGFTCRQAGLVDHCPNQAKDQQSWRSQLRTPGLLAAMDPNCGTIAFLAADGLALFGGLSRRKRAADG
jgi:hypothetical protein